MTNAGESLGARAWRKMRGDPFALWSMIVVTIYLLMAMAVKFNWLPMDISATVGPSYGKPSWDHLLGTDIFGRDVLARVIHGTKIAMSVGFVATLIAVPIGILLGALGGFFSGWIDDFVVWLYSTLSSIPYLLLLLALAFVLGKGIVAVYIALGVTSWVDICRVVRGEILKLRERDYVAAARALGASPFRIILRHLLPNVLPLIFINASLLFVSAIKSEVILSYLGVGVQGEPSWGIMISDARLELIGRGVYWQLLGATIAMFIIILALNILSDSLRDAFDPRLAGPVKKESK
jgi:ABC-type dipeptide/oligopeptide/nickel transport system permease subunit